MRQKGLGPYPHGQNMTVRSEVSGQKEVNPQKQSFLPKFMRSLFIQLGALSIVAVAELSIASRKR